MKPRLALRVLTPITYVTYVNVRLFLCIEFHRRYCHRTFFCHTKILKYQNFAQWKCDMNLSQCLLHPQAIKIIKLSLNFLNGRLSSSPVADVSFVLSINVEINIEYLKISIIILRIDLASKKSLLLVLIISARCRTFSLPVDRSENFCSLNSKEKTLLKQKSGLCPHICIDK